MRTEAELPVEVARQTTDSGEEYILEHFGVKGMHWGVRKENVAAVGRAAKSAGGKVGKAADAVSRFAGDTAFERNLQSETSRNSINMSINAKARQAFRRTDLPALKERHGDYGKLRNRATKPFSKEARAYRKDARETYIKRLEDAANSMTNASGTRQYTIRERGWELPAEGGALPKSKHYWDVTTREIKHADGDFTWTLEVLEDNDGYITDLSPVDANNSMQQSVELGEEFVLEHYGVKGMHWGVRKAAAVTTQTHIDTGLRRRRTKVQAKGGESHPASADAITAEVQKQKLKKSGTAALSNKELNELRTRLQLEAQVELLATKKGQKFVAKQLEEQGKQQLQKGIGEGIRKGGPHVIKKVRKGAATAATIGALAL
jgi:hypothetical protein